VIAEEFLRHTELAVLYADINDLRRNVIRDTTVELMKIV